MERECSKLNCVEGDLAGNTSDRLSSLQILHYLTRPLFNSISNEIFYQ